jgi:hypothetical protein
VQWRSRGTVVMQYLPCGMQMSQNFAMVFMCVKHLFINGLAKYYQFHVSSCLPRAFAVLRELKAMASSSANGSAWPAPNEGGRYVSDLPLCLGGCGVPADKGHQFCCTECRFSSSSPGPRRHTTNCLRWYQERTGVTFQCASPLCKREAAIGYKTCCRTCKSSLSAQHGPKCNRHWAETIRRDRPRLGPDPGARQDQWQISCDDTAGDADDAWTETDETEKAKPHFQPGEERNSLQAQPLLSKEEADWTNVPIPFPDPVEQTSDFSCGWDEITRPPLCCGKCGLTAAPEQDFCCVDCHTSTLDGRRPRRHCRPCLSWFQQHTGTTLQCENVGCKREAALGYYTCCRTCGTTLSREHGGVCNAAWMRLSVRDPPDEFVAQPSSSNQAAKDVHRDDI